MGETVAARDAQQATSNAGGPVGGDLLFGAESIAEFLFGERRFKRRVYNLVETRALPVFRIGASVCARKSVLLAFIGEQEQRDRLAANACRK